LSHSLLSREPTSPFLSGKGPALSLPGRDPAGAVLGPSLEAEDTPARMLLLFGRLLALLLAGYFMFDKAFAYLHLPGTPLYVAEIVLTVGFLGCLAATGYLRVVIKNEPILALLGAFFLWGFLRFLPGLRTYGILAVRDFALVYYCLFAFFMAAVLARSPQLLMRWIAQFDRLIPWLLIWLPPATILGSITSISGLNVPFSPISVFTHSAGSSALAALLALGVMWLFPGQRSSRSRVLWSLLALVTVVLAATQNRGGLLSVMAGALVGLAFYRDRMRLIARAGAVIAVVLIVSSVLPLKVQLAGWQQRSFSVSQLFANVASIGGKQEAGNLNSTAAGREQLWTAVYDKQVSDGTLVYGSGFGVNLATAVGVYETTAAQQNNPLRSPHNSHLDVLARLGLVGIALWIVLWVGWYWRLIAGCQRLLRHGLLVRRRVAVLCLMMVTAVLVGSVFDPQLEGAQVAAILWTACGIGAMVTSFRTWNGRRDLSVIAPNHCRAVAPSGSDSGGN
jgi:O-antigen ligase